MAQLEIRELSHAYSQKPHYPDDFALQNIDLNLQDGRAFALLGPSGCGKSTLLKMISGLLQPTQGQVWIGGKDVTHLDARQRHVAEVFQFPVIYPTMNVFDNLAFPLRNRGLDREAVAMRVGEVAELLGLSDQLNRKPASLAASARQLVSLGRGLVRTDVNAILFDEPLTVIDPQEKWYLRTRLKQLHQRFRLTMIYVTHDQTEALTFADTVMVMREGRVLQSGTPGELFDTPSHKFVGQFVGSPGMNFMRCQPDGNVAKIAGHSIPLGKSLHALVENEQYELGFRPEHCRFSRDGSGLSARLLNVDCTSRRKIAYLDAAGTKICVSLPADQDIPADDHRIVIDPQRALIYASGRLIEAQL